MNPEKARRLWSHLLQHVGTDDNQSILVAILESVVIDIISNKMMADPVFANVIGQRITTLYEARQAAQDEGSKR